MQSPPPVIIEDTPTHFNFTLPINSQIILKCKCQTHKKPTSIKWFKKKDIDNLNESYPSFLQKSSRTIKYFESFYEPLVSLGVKELDGNILLSKLSVNEITQSSIYVCVAINYFGFSFRESYINVAVSETDYDLEEKEEVLDFPERNHKILFLIPVVLLMPISMLICTILYLLINRQMLKRNKSSETIFL